MPEIKETTHLKDLWNETEAQKMAGNQLALLRYRSNLLGADLRITNFGGGNTSSKLELPDPFTGRSVRVLAVKGSGGDLGSITESGFALLYLDLSGGISQPPRLRRAKARTARRFRNIGKCCDWNPIGRASIIASAEL
jgi:rhamnose utilization protein RhaD (predicted bifunctional aldolase and dehydrogenase)